MLEIRTLGGLSLMENGRPIENLGSSKAEAILVYLAVEGKQQNRNVLASLFWPESPEERAASSLRVVLASLNKKIGAYLEITRNTVAIKPHAKYYLDLSDLEANLLTDQVEQALGLYQGDFLRGFYLKECLEFEDWLRLEQEHIQRLFITTLHDSVSNAIVAGEYNRGLKFSRKLLELDPLDERSHQQTMLLLALDGQRTAALVQYEKCCQIFSAELGVEPSQEIQTLYKRIMQGDTLGGFIPIIPVHNLPASQTSFIGRETELGQICSLLRDTGCHLITLVGQGGSGKTRLALQAASKTLRDFKHGTYFVPLENVNSPGFLIPTMAQAMNLELDTFITQLDPKTQLFDYLRDREVLFVLDGFEHLVESAIILSQMLVYAPGVKLLVTSRKKCGLQAEWLFPVEGMVVPQKGEELPQRDYEAVRLFNERARQVSIKPPSYEENEHVTRICQLVEGLPLGIELAASWLSILSAHEIATEIEKSVDFLTTELQDVPERHRSLRAVFDRSWRLLNSEQQGMFAKLSVFRGNFDRKAARQIVRADQRHLSALIDLSLLKRIPNETFRMHALMRQFANEKLNQQPETEEEIYNQHSFYYVNMLSQHEDDFMGTRMLEARNELRLVMENMRAAVDWASLNWDSRAARKMLISLLCFYAVQGWHEGIEAFGNIARLKGEALECKGSTDPLQDAVILGARIHQAFLLTQLGQIDQSEDISRECLQPLRQLDLREELSECLHNLGTNASFRGEYEDAIKLLEEAILVGRGCNHCMWPIYLLWLGHTYFLMGEYEQGLETLQTCYDIFDQRGNLWGSAFALDKMGLAADGLKEHANSMKYHHKALAIFERLSNQAGTGYSLSRMSMSAYFLKDYAQAVDLGEQGLRIFTQLGHRWGICVSSCRLGFAQIGLGKLNSAEQYFKSALHQSHQEKMIPLCLYALLGLACIFVRRGFTHQGAELFYYCQHHSQTPAPYIDMAAQWVGEAVEAHVEHSDRSAVAGDKLENIEEVVERILES